MTDQELNKWLDLYENLGFVLFPVGKNKIPPPAMKKWQDFLKAPMSREMLVYWVQERGMYLAAITSDKTFYAVDDDYPKEPKLKRPANTELESTVIAKTQGGGFHYYFKPFSMKNKQNIKIGKNEFFKIDLRGNSPGYVLIPPFGGYEWVKKPSKQAMENLPDTPPKAIMDIWNTKKELSPQEINTDDFFDVIGIDSFRDPVLFERSFVLWQNHYKNPTHYTPQYIAAILKEFNNNFNPPKSMDVVKKCFKQGEKYASSWAHEQGLIKVEQKIPEINLGKLKEEDLKKFKNYEMLKVGIDQLDQAGIPTGMNLIIGQSGAGKSWFMNHIVKSAYELNQKRSVVFSLEMDQQGLTKRMLQSYSNLTAQAMKKNPNIDEGVKKIREISPVIVDYTQVDRDAVTPLSFSRLTHQYYMQGYRIFLFDHFHEIPGISTNEKNQQQTEIWGDAFKAIRNTYDDVWMFILVQSNKAGYKKDILTKEFVSGSSALVNKCDYFLSLNREEKPDSNVVLELNKAKNILFWVDKNRRSYADRFAVKAVLTNTGNFKDAGEFEFKNKINPSNNETQDAYWNK